MSRTAWQELAEPLKTIHAQHHARASQDRSRFASDSHAFLETSAEPFAGDWSAHPALDTAIGGPMLVVAALDHLLALATLLEAEAPMIYSLYTTARGVLDVGATAWHLLEPGIPTKTRIARWYNGELRSKHEYLRMLDGSPEGQAETDRATRRIATILDSAKKAGFQTNKGDKMRPPWIGERPAATTGLVGGLVSARVPRLGKLYWQNWSAIAHGQQYGLASFLKDARPLDDPRYGDQGGTIQLGPQQAALQLIAAPIAAVAVLERLYSYYGWGRPESSPVTQSLAAWWHFSGANRGRTSAVPATFLNPGY